MIHAVVLSAGCFASPLPVECQGNQALAGCEQHQKYQANMFTLKIETHNAAFGDDENEGGRAAEVARILHDAADRIGEGDTSFNLLDYNGNAVGTAKLTNR